jgi:type II secretory pathway pseudopilin PulG
MKSLYIIAFLALGASAYAQQNKKAQESDDQAQVVKQLREREAQQAKDLQENAPKKQAVTTLASEQGLEVKKQDAKAQNSSSNNSSGKLLPNTATITEIKASIPNRQVSRTNTANSRNTNSNVVGLPNTATLEEIKKTIPKN